MKSTKDIPTLPEVKKNIRALLISAPRGLSVEDIEHDYQAVLGKFLPFEHFKCKTALEFLKTMPDVVCPTWSNGLLILKGIADESSKHIAKLVARQNVNSRKSRRIHKAPISTKPLVVPNDFRKNIKELLSVYPNGILGSSLNQSYLRHYGHDISPTKLGFKSMSQLLNAIQDIVTIVKNPKGGYRVCAVKKTPPPVRKKSPLLPAPSSKPLPSSCPPSKPQSQNVPPSNTQSKNITYSGALSSRTSLSQPEAPKTSAHSIPAKRKPLTDFNSLEVGVNVRKEQDKRNVEKVKDLLDSKSGVGDSMKDELVSVLVKRPNGVWAARLPFEYKTLMGKELNILKMGFYSVIEMASAMPDVFRIERPFPNGDWLLFLGAKSRKDKNITRVYLPENVIGKGVGYTKQTLPKEHFIELYITHIRTPDCFWLQLLKYATKVEELQDEMREFYSSKASAKFMVDDSLIKLGQVCVARFPVDHDWYRALITATSSQSVVEVFYVDYGNTSQVSKSDIRLMKKEFFQLPSQAIKSKLANVKPKMTSNWDSSASHRMHELTANKPLCGLLSGKKGDVLDLYICDTNGKDDVYINDKLVEEGYAKFKQVGGGSTSPDLPSFEPAKQEMNQHITLETLQPTPTFPDYSVPLNHFQGYSYDSLTSLLPPVEASLPPMQEKIPLINMDEEKPTEEDLEFMRKVCEQLSDAVDVIVKRLDLPDNKVVHVIKFEEKPFVVRSEISALLWDADLLRSMLRNAKKVVEKEIISREDHEGLFDDLRRLKIGDFAEGEQAKEYASMYPLSTIPDILETFNHPLPELVQMIKTEVATYEQSPETYWGSENDNADDGTDESCQSEEEHDLEELRLAEQALQFARKRILRAMTNGDLTPDDNIVDEAADVERRLANIRELIIIAEAKEAARDTVGSKESQVTQEDKVVVANDVGVVGNGLNEALPSQAEQQPVKPVGVTRPEIRQPPAQKPDIPLSAPSYPSIPTSTPGNPNIPLSTSQRSCIPTSTPQYSEIPVSAPYYPTIPTSTPQNSNIPLSTSQSSCIPSFTPQYPNILTSSHQFPNISTTTPHHPIVSPPTSKNPNLSNAVPQNPTETLGNIIGQENFSSANAQGGKVAHIIAPGNKTVCPETSMGSEQSYKDLVESGKKTIEKMSLENMAQQTPQSTSNKRVRSSSQSYHHVPHPNQPMAGPPVFMQGGHMTSFPQMNFAFPYPPNVQFGGFLGQLQPLLPSPHPDLVRLNGPLSAPANLLTPAQLLFQYGSPFPDAHPRRSQR